MEKPCPKCGMMFGSHSSGCPEAKNPFAEVERLVAPQPEAESVRVKQVKKARATLRAVEGYRREIAAKEHRLGSDPELEMMTPKKRWEKIKGALEGKIERLAGKIQDAKTDDERQRLMVRFKGLTSFKEKVDAALVDGITEEENAVLMKDPDSVYALSGGDVATEIDRDLMLEEDEKLKQATGRLSAAVGAFDVAQSRVEQEEMAAAITPEEQGELDKGLDDRLKKAYKFIARERLAEAEVSKIDIWLDGDPEADAESLDNLPLNEALRRLSFFRDELWRVEHLPEKTAEEKESKNLERKRLVVWRDALLRRIETPKIDLRLWDVAERAEGLEKADILHFDEAEKRRMSVMWVARRIADNGLSENVLRKLIDAKGRLEFSESEAKIIMTAALTHVFSIEKDELRGRKTRAVMAEVLRWEGVTNEKRDMLWEALMKYANKGWAKGLLDLVSLQPYGISGKKDERWDTKAMKGLDRRLMGLVYAKMMKTAEGKYRKGWRLVSDWEWEQSNLPQEDRKMLESFWIGATNG